jgi:hypothetical protein
MISTNPRSGSIQCVVDRCLSCSVAVTTQRHTWVSSNFRHSTYARDPSAAPDDWHCASSLAALSVIWEMTCARSWDVGSQAHEPSITPNRPTLMQRGVVARIAISSERATDLAPNGAGIRWAENVLCRWLMMYHPPTRLGRFRHAEKIRSYWKPDLNMDNVYSPCLADAVQAEARIAYSIGISCRDPARFPCIVQTL